MPIFSHSIFSSKENYRDTHDILAEFITVIANQEARHPKALQPARVVPTEVRTGRESPIGTDAPGKSEMKE